MKRSIKSLLYPTTQRAIASVAIIALTGALGLPTAAVAKEKSNGKPVTVNIKKSSKNKTKETNRKQSSAKVTKQTKADREQSSEKKSPKNNKLSKIEKQNESSHAKTREKSHEKSGTKDKKHAEKVATASKQAKQPEVTRHTSRDTKHDGKKLATLDKKHKTSQREEQHHTQVKQDQPATDKHAKRERETKQTSRADKFSKAAELAKLENLKSSAQDNNAKLQLSQRQQAKAAKLSQKTANTPQKAAYYEIPQQVGAKQTRASVPAHYQAAPQADDAAEAKKAGRMLQVGKASYYSDSFDGGRTASGERFDQDKLTCAHSSLPFGCKIRVTNLHNNRSVDVKVNDRGGFAKHGRVVDLSKAAAREIGLVGRGVGKVKIEVVE